MKDPRHRLTGQSRTALRGIALLLSIHSCLATAQAADPLPPSVRQFAQKRSLCDHFRGEDADDPGRQREIERGLAVNCKGTDAALRRLKAAFRTKPSVVKFLGHFEYPVE